MNSSITTELISFLLKNFHPSDEVKEKAIEHIIDGLAVMLAGSRTESSKKLVDLIREKGETPISTLIGFNFKSYPSDAALANGTSGHADDYDDTQLSNSPDRIYGLLTHPTTPVLAATLAVGEKVGCSGEDFIKAFIAGFEVECKIAEAIQPEHYRRGFHTTGTIGVFGATAASSYLLELDEARLRYAFGIAASMSSGIRVNFGTMTKPLHAGMAASNGVTASVLAKKGFTSDTNALDGQWGFMAILGGGVDQKKIKGKLGKPYTLISPGASIKMYPCGSLGQPSMDTMLEIVLEQDVRPEDVHEVRLFAGPNILEPLRYQKPINELQAKFSIHFGLACILVRRKAGLREYTIKTLKDRKINEAMGKVKTILDQKLADIGTDKMRSIIEVELENGKVIRRVADTARGTPEKPLKEYELFNKFRECAVFALDTVSIDRLLEKIKNIRKISDIRELTSLLA